MLLYKFKPSEPLAHVVDILLEQRLYCATYTELNDPFEGQFISEFRDSVDLRMVTGVSSLFGPTNMVVRSRKTVADLPVNKDACRVCSLTSELNDVRMWSLYASGHRGLAFELDIDGLDPAAREVTYHPELRVCGTSLLAAPYPEDVLTRKTTHWEYEREFRLVTSEQHVSIAGRIRRVVLGARATPLLERLVRQLAEDKFPVARAVLDVDGVSVSA